MEGDDMVSTLSVEAAVEVDLRERRPHEPVESSEAMLCEPAVDAEATPASVAAPASEPLTAAPPALFPSKEEVVEHLFRAFSERDLLSTLALMHQEIVFEPMTAAVTRAGEPYRGHEGMRRYVADVEAHWEELSIQPVQVRAAGRAVVVLGMTSGRGAAGSFEDVPTTWVLKFRDGLVSHVQVFSDARHVREALVGDDA
jgi:ketosteroid isomerase-like protein